MTSEELYKRLLLFGQEGLKFVKILPKTPQNAIYGNQLIRSTSSCGANYIEALEASSTNDFVHRLRICKKEARESTHWVLLIQSDNETNSEVVMWGKILLKEANELVKIFSSSIVTAENNKTIKKLNGK